MRQDAPGIPGIPALGKPGFHCGPFTPGPLVWPGGPLPVAGDKKGHQGNDPKEGPSLFHGLHFNSISSNDRSSPAQRSGQFVRQDGAMRQRRLMIILYVAGNKKGYQGYNQKQRLCSFHSIQISSGSWVLSIIIFFKTAGILEIDFRLGQGYPH